MDDADETRINTKWFLANFGYAVDSVRSAEEALVTFDPVLHDLVFTDTRVAHNVIFDQPYTGVSIGYRWNSTSTSQVRCVAEYNHIYDVMKTLADGGGFYTLGFQPGTILRGNLIHDVHRSAYAHGGAPNNGFFIDERSKGFLIESNVVHKTSGESVRFNQCQREWHTWKGNAFDGNATAARIAEAAERAGLQPAYKSVAAGAL